MQESTDVSMREGGRGGRRAEEQQLINQIAEILKQSYDHQIHHGAVNCWEPNQKEKIHIDPLGL